VRHERWYSAITGDFFLRGVFRKLVRILLTLLMLVGLAAPGLVLGSMRTDCAMACCRLSDHCSRTGHRMTHNGVFFNAGHSCGAQCGVGAGLAGSPTLFVPKLSASVFLLVLLVVSSSSVAVLLAAQAAVMWQRPPPSETRERDLETKGEKQWRESLEVLLCFWLWPLRPRLRKIFTMRVWMGGSRMLQAV
jgi:hypothetical protein